MTITAIQLPGPLYVGNAATVGVTFSNPVFGQPRSEWPPVDPTVVTLTYVPGTGGTPVTLTYATMDSLIDRVDVGEYICELPNDVVGLWKVRWKGTGACAALFVGEYLVSPLPF